MRWSNLFIPTRREEPSEGDPRLRLLIRAGYVRYLESGLDWLFLGQRTLDKIAVSFKLGPPPLERVTNEGSERVHYGSADSQHETALRNAALEGFRSVGVSVNIDDPRLLTPESFHTPNIKTIAELSVFSGKPRASLIKSVVMAAASELILVLVRGDHNLSESKLRAIVNGDVRAATADEIGTRFGASPGSIGPVGLAGVRILADEALRERTNMICGANRDDYHLRHVTPGVHFEAEYRDLRMPAESPGNEGVPFLAPDGRTLGHIKREKTTFSEVTIVISLNRILMLLAESGRDASGLVMPPSIAPFSVVFSPVNIRDDAQRTTAERLYQDALAAGCDALLDDRDERPGVKFKDAELIGIPWRVTIGKKLAEGKVEILERRGSVQLETTVDNAVAFVRDRWDAY